jgi:very-short-patch-repair endonuclease
MAAVLACGDGAALSHRSAAALWGLLRPRDRMVDVTVPARGGRRKRAGIRLHRSSSMAPAAVTRRSGIPVTTPARTIDDLRRTAPPFALRRAIRQAELLGLGLSPSVEPDHTRSDLERRFLRLCRVHRIEQPEVNVRIGSDEVDFLWRERGLVVELDSYRYHGIRSAFETDRARDVRLKLLGFEVVRFTDRQLAENPHGLLHALADLLTRRS